MDVMTWVIWLAAFGGFLVGIMFDTAVGIVIHKQDGSEGKLNAREQSSSG